MRCFPLAASLAPYFWRVCYSGEPTSWSDTASRGTSITSFLCPSGLLLRASYLGHSSLLRDIAVASLEEFWNSEDRLWGFCLSLSSGFCCRRNRPTFL